MKFLFNLLRNISFIIILGIIGISIYFVKNEDVQDNFLALLEEKNAYEEVVTDENDNFDIQVVEESPTGEKPKKIKIKVKGGFAYLRPSQIMYINSNPVELITISEKRIKPKLKLYELEELLNNRLVRLC